MDKNNNYKINDGDNNNDNINNSDKIDNNYLENNRFSFIPTEKISIFVGAYGSGKSEVAVNFALFLSKKMSESITRNESQSRHENTIYNEIQSHNESQSHNENQSGHDFPINKKITKYNSVVLADLDMINPYFRSVDAKKVLNDHGIYVISPQFANTNVEVPALPGEVFSVFDQEAIRAVLDIGGEDLGARVVSSLKSRILTVSSATYMVVNMNRPFTNSKDKIIVMMRELEEATGLKTSGIVNNTNLLSYSCTQDLLEANMVLSQVCQETEVPLVFSSGMNGDYPAEWGNKTPDGIPFLRLSRTITYE